MLEIATRSGAAKPTLLLLLLPRACALPQPEICVGSVCEARALSLCDAADAGDDLTLLLPEDARGRALKKKKACFKNKTCYCPKARG